MPFVLDRALKDTVTAGAGTNFDMAKLSFSEDLIEYLMTVPTAWDLVEKKPFIGSKGESFECHGPVVAAPHADGAELLGQEQAKEQRWVYLEDEEYIAEVYRGKPDDIIAHVNSKPDLIKKAGDAILSVWNMHTLMVMANAAEMAARGTFPGGNVVTATAAGATSVEDVFPDTEAGSLAIQAALKSINIAQRNKRIPSTVERWAYMSPYLAGVLRNDNTLLSRDYVGEAYSDKITGKLLMVEGFWIMEVPEDDFPSTDTSASVYPDLPKINGTASYGGDHSQLAIVTASRPGVAGLDGESVRPIMDWIPHRQSWLVGAAALKGLGWKQPEYMGRVDWAAA
jgi:hypothetical protein